MTGEGAVVSKHGHGGDDRDAADVGCYRNSSSGGTRPEWASDAPPLLAKDTLDQPPSSMPWRCTKGRTSTTPPSRAAGQRAAISRTGSRLSASKR